MSILYSLSIRPAGEAKFLILHYDDSEFGEGDNSHEATVISICKGESEFVSWF